jgi:hypothetical protein
VVQHQNLVGHRRDRVDDVFDHHQCQAVPAQRVDQLERRVDLARAQPGEDLVEQ